MNEDVERREGGEGTRRARGEEREARRDPGEGRGIRVAERRARSAAAARARKARGPRTP